MKGRKSPSILHIPKISLPLHFVEYVQRILQHENIKSLEEEADKLFAYLRYRKPPIEEDEYQRKVQDLEDDLKDDLVHRFLSEDELRALQKSHEHKLRNKLKREIYHWKPLNYDRSSGLSYLISRTPAEYAVLTRIFHEMNRRDPTFKPEYLFDFGSGIGSGIWAARGIWSDTIKEHVCVDSSGEMNELAELLIRKGSFKNEPVFPGVYFRQFLPMRKDRTYDIVLSSYSLLELSSAKSRMETLNALWKKTRKYLVVVEMGSNAAFEVINEARDYILHYESQYNEGHVFAPCPHDLSCPRFMQARTPCNFHLGYRPLLPFHKDMTKSEVYSYVVFKKGKRNGQDEKWPRLVRDPLLRGKHVICRLCTKSGELEETVLTKSKHIRPLYACARRSHCGDLLPVTEKEVLRPQDTLE